MDNAKAQETTPNNDKVSHSRDTSASTGTNAYGIFFKVCAINTFVRTAYVAYFRLFTTSDNVLLAFSFCAHHSFCLLNTSAAHIPRHTRIPFFFFVVFFFFCPTPNICTHRFVLLFNCTLAVRSVCIIFGSLSSRMFSPSVDHQISFDAQHQQTRIRKGNAELLTFIITRTRVTEWVTGTSLYQH